MVLKRTFVHIGVMGRRMQPLNVRFDLTESSLRAGPESVRGLFANVSNQTGLDTMSKAQRPIKVEIKGGVGKEPKLEPCWSVLFIEPLSALWV